mgnify:CR=1 FL=1
MSLFFASNAIFSRCLSLISVLIGAVLLSLELSITNALLAVFVVWPTLASLLLLFAPIFRVRKIVIVVVAALLILVEHLVL